VRGQRGFQNTATHGLEVLLGGGKKLGPSGSILTDGVKGLFMKIVRKAGPRKKGGTGCPPGGMGKAAVNEGRS